MGQWDEAQFVDDQQAEAGKLLLQVEKPSLVPGLHQRVDRPAAVANPTDMPLGVLHIAKMFAKAATCITAHHHHPSHHMLAHHLNLSSHLPFRGNAVALLWPVIR